MFSLLLEPTTLASSIPLFLLTLVALATIFPLIVLAEMVVLQLMRWGKFRPCLKAAVQMNGFTFVLGLILMLLITKPTAGQLLIFLALEIVIEALVLNRLKPGSAGGNWRVSLLANAVSYILLIVPAFKFQ